MKIALFDVKPYDKEFFEKLGVNHLIYPEVLAAQEIAESLKTNWLRQNLSFCNNALILLAIKVRANAQILNTKFNTGFFDQENFRVDGLGLKSKILLLNLKDLQFQ